MGLSAYGMRDWSLAEQHFKALKDEFPNNSEANKELKRAQARISENQSGKFDFVTLHSASLNGKREFDIADYTGKIEIVKIPGKGNI